MPFVPFVFDFLLFFCELCCLGALHISQTRACGFWLLYVHFEHCHAMVLFRAPHLGGAGRRTGGDSSLCVHRYSSPFPESTIPHDREHNRHMCFCTYKFNVCCVTWFVLFWRGLEHLMSSQQLTMGVVRRRTTSSSSSSVAVHRTVAS